MKASFTAFVAFLIAFLVVSTIAWQDAAAAEANSETVAVEPAQPELPDWRRYAALSKESGEAPIVAVVIDNLGHSEGEFSRVMELGQRITLAFLPYTARVA